MKKEKITGYRNLSQREITEINDIKEMAHAVEGMMLHLEQMADADKRWVAIAKTHLQQGFMAAVRSIAKPTTF